MSDLERLLRESLKKVGDDYAPADPTGAKQRFLTRRRRRTITLVVGGTALAGAATALALVAFLSVEGPPKRGVPVASRTTDAVVSARIEVGAKPSGIGAGGGFVWVANSGTGTISKLDPETDEVVLSRTVGFEGNPDDVVVASGWVWAISDAGEYIRIEPDTGEIEDPVRSVGRGDHLDVAAGTGEDIWLLESGGDAYQVDAASGEVTWRLRDGEDLTDVATSNGSVWVYDRGSGYVIGYDSATHRELGRTRVGTTGSQDLSAGGGYTWFYRDSDGVLLQIEQATGTITKEYPLGGTFGAISIGPDGVYVLVVDGGPEGSGQGRLFRFDATRATRIGKTVALSDLPFDITWGEGAIWVTNNSGDAVTRIDLVSKGTTPSVAGPADTLLFYAAGGDIYSYDAAEASEAVVATAALESSPTVAPDGAALVYQRGEGPRAKVVYRALTEGALFGEPGDERVIARGEAPSFGPDGRLAWVVPAGPSSVTGIAIGMPGAGDPLEIPVDSGLGPPEVDRIEWTSDGSAVYFSASERTIYRADLPASRVETIVASQEVSPQEEGAVFVSPEVNGADELALVRLCCEPDPGANESATADLGFVEEGAFTKEIGLDDLGWEPSLDIEAFWTGGLEYEGEDGWSRSGEPTWLVTNREELWIVNAETREFDNLGVAGVDHIALAPGALR
jgi:DNA-binding beta-propeller fold protein YncE